MDEQQEQQKPGDSTENSTADISTTNRSIEQQQADAEAAKEKAAKEQQAAANQEKANQEKGSAGTRTGLLSRMEHGIEGASGIEAWQRRERRRQAFESAKAGPVGAAINDVNAFLEAMHDCDADTPEAMLADSDVQQAAKRARDGLKVFTGDTPVTFAKPTSDAHLNVGSGGAVTGNTAANRERTAAVKAAHDDEEQEAVPGVAKVPQPDALVR